MQCWLPWSWRLCKGLSFWCIEPWSGTDSLSVDEEKCVGCGACERTCPKDIIEVKTPSERFLHFNTKDDGLAPCRQTCPAEINIPLYIQQIKKGDYEGAVHTIRERNPLLLSCGKSLPSPL